MLRKSYVPNTPQTLALRRSDVLASSSGRGSTGGYRKSMARLSIFESVRRSSVSRDGRKERVPTDKNSNVKNYQSLIAFLSECNYTLPSTIRLQNFSGSTKDICNLVMFILGFIYPDYPAIKKFDEEFPVLMATLKYPFTITKRQLQPVGSAHNWPCILHALSWLASVAKYQQILEACPNSTIPESTEGIAKMAAFKLNFGAYKLFMSDKEDLIPSHDEEFFARGLEHFDGLGGNEVAQMVELEAKLKDTLEDLESETTRERVLDEELLNIQSDQHKLQTFEVESNVYIDNLKLATQNTKDKNEEFRMTIEQLEKILKEKQAVVANQKYTIYDVQQKKVQIAHLQTQCSTSKSVLEEHMKDLNELELDLLNKNEKIKNEIEEYHRLASNCQLVPSTAENAKGYDYSVFLQNPESDVSPSNLADLTGRLKLILKQCKEANRALSADDMKLLDDVNQMKNILTSRKNDIIDMNSKVVRQEELLMFKEQEFKKASKSLQLELEELEENIDDLKKEAHGNNAEELELKVIELRTKYKNMKIAMAKREKELEKYLVNMVEDFLKFQKRIQIKISEVTDQVQKWNENRVYNKESQFNKNQIAINELKEKAMQLKEETLSTMEELKRLKLL